MHASNITNSERKSSSGLWLVEVTKIPIKLLEKYRRIIREEPDRVSNTYLKKYASALADILRYSLNFFHHMSHSIRGQSIHDAYSTIRYLQNPRQHDSFRIILSIGRMNDLSTRGMKTVEFTHFGYGTQLVKFNEPVQCFCSQYGNSTSGVLNDKDISLLRYGLSLTRVSIFLEFVLTNTKLNNEDVGKIIVDYLTINSFVEVYLSFKEYLKNYHSLDPVAFGATFDSYYSKQKPGFSLLGTSGFFGTTRDNAGVLVDKHEKTPASILVHAKQKPGNATDRAVKTWEIDYKSAIKKI